MSTTTQQDPEQQAPRESYDLLKDSPDEGYMRGAVKALVLSRNSQLGNLLLADRALYYVQILYALLLFRRNHELEPLYDDIYDRARVPLADMSADGEYSFEQFRADVDQLDSWALVTSRIETERLRGYRDTRKRKFRYSLTGDSVSFLEWLEERCEADREGGENDTRDLLEEVCGSLRELLRLLGSFKTKRSRDGDARRVLYQLLKIEGLTFDTADHLGDFNALLLTFVIREYELQDAKQILKDLEEFVEHFLLQIYQLRNEIVGLLETLREPRQSEKLRICGEMMEDERRKAPRLLRPSQDIITHGRLPDRLFDFYRTNGQLDRLCRRIHESALRVWRKLHAHLRELERRNNRIEDLRDRLTELAACDEDTVPRRFLRGLLSPAVMFADPQYWDEHEKADPPMPRRRSTATRTQPRVLLAKKSRADAPVISMEQARLERLRSWIEDHFAAPGQPGSFPLSQGNFRGPEAFQRIMETAKAALLGSGQSLRRADFEASVDEATEARVDLDHQSLAFLEMMLQRTRTRRRHVEKRAQ